MFQNNTCFFKVIEIDFWLKIKLNALKSLSGIKSRELFLHMPVELIPDVSIVKISLDFQIICDSVNLWTSESDSKEYLECFISRELLIPWFNEYPVMSISLEAQIIQLVFNNDTFLISRPFLGSYDNIISLEWFNNELYDLSWMLSDFFIHNQRLLMLHFICLHWDSVSLPKVTNLNLKIWFSVFMMVINFDSWCWATQSKTLLLWLWSQIYLDSVIWAVDNLQEVVSHLFFKHEDFVEDVVTFPIFGFAGVLEVFHCGLVKAFIFVIQDFSQKIKSSWCDTSLS